MAKTTVEVLVDDLDGSEALETVRLGWDGEWRELDLSRRNLAALSRVFDKYWNAGRPAGGERRSTRANRKKSPSRSTRARRDPKVIRAWATENGIEMPARGRIPTDVERQYNEAHSRT